MSGSSIQSDAVQNPRVTWEGCSVLLDINDGDRLIFARLSPASTLKIGNQTCSLQPLIGCPFGSLFQVEIGPRGPYFSRILSNSEDSSQEKGDDPSQDESKDNRSLVDNNMAQSLTGEDIDKMRRQGATGDQIVEALIANSATFDKKTSFSQEKYRLRKQKKYAPRVLLRRPFARSICEAYFKKNPVRIGFLRVDTLSLLLSMANVTAYSDVLVVDMVGGILTGAVAERLGGTGYVCNTYMGFTPYAIDIVKMFNFSNEISKRILRSQLSDLSLCQNGTCDQIGQTEMDTETHSTGTFSSLLLDSVNIEEETVSPVIKVCKKTAKCGEKASQEAIKSWKENGFSSLIIAAPELDTWEIIQELLPLVSYSAPFAIYHQYLQPLATCMHNLQLGKMAIGLQISEPWLREYQVLPSRTHPSMQMSAFGGYILSGTRICCGDSQLPKK